jgi:hypothetical protein
MARGGLTTARKHVGLHRAFDEFAMPTLAQIYEDHAEDCIRAAARTDDPKPRDELLHLAIKWRDDAQALRCEAMQWSLGTLRMAQIYEDHAEDYILVAASTNDTKRRDVLLDLAVQWRDEAEALRRGGARPEVALSAPTKPTRP